MMAARKNKATAKNAAAKTTVGKQVAQSATSNGRRIDERNPQSWLYLDPAGVSEEGWHYGVLRKNYLERVNSAFEFGWRKTHVGPNSKDAEQSIWSPNAYSVEVLLPPHASDELADPVALLRAVDRYASADEKALLTCLTLPMLDLPHIHLGWERARSFSFRLTRERELAVVLVQHCPALAGSGFAPHAHALIVPRRIGRFGLRQALYDRPLTKDDGQALLHEMWSSHCETFA